MSDPLKDNTNTTRDKYDGKWHTEAERERGLAELDDAVRETWRERDATLLELKKMRQTAEDRNKARADVVRAALVDTPALAKALEERGVLASDVELGALASQMTQVRLPTIDDASEDPTARAMARENVSTRRASALRDLYATRRGALAATMGELAAKKKALEKRRVELLREGDRLSERERLQKKYWYEKKKEEELGMYWKDFENASGSSSEDGEESESESESEEEEDGSVDGRDPDDLLADIKPFLLPPREEGDGDGAPTRTREELTEQLKRELAGGKAATKMRLLQMKIAHAKVAAQSKYAKRSVAADPLAPKPSKKELRAMRAHTPLDANYAGKTVFRFCRELVESIAMGAAHACATRPTERSVAMERKLWRKKEPLVIQTICRQLADTLTLEVTREEAFGVAYEIEAVHAMSAGMVVKAIASGVIHRLRGEQEALEKGGAKVVRKKRRKKKRGFFARVFGDSVDTAERKYAEIQRRVAESNRQSELDKVAAFEGYGGEEEEGLSSSSDEEEGSFMHETQTERRAMASVLTEMQRRRPPGYIYRHTQPLRDVSPPREPQPVRVQRESDSDDSTSSDGSSSEEDVERVEDEASLRELAAADAEQAARRQPPPRSGIARLGTLVEPPPPSMTHRNASTRERAYWNDVALEEWYGGGALAVKKGHVTAVAASPGHALSVAAGSSTGNITVWRFGGPNDGISAWEASSGSESEDEFGNKIKRTKEERGRARNERARIKMLIKMGKLDQATVDEEKRKALEKKMLQRKKNEEKNKKKTAASANKFLVKTDDANSKKSTSLKFEGAAAEQKVVGHVVQPVVTGAAKCRPLADAEVIEEMTAANASEPALIATAIVGLAWSADASQLCTAERGGCSRMWTVADRGKETTRGRAAPLAESLALAPANHVSSSPLPETEIVKGSSSSESEEDKRDSRGKKKKKKKVVVVTEKAVIEKAKKAKEALDAAAARAEARDRWRPDAKILTTFFPAFTMAGRQPYALFARPNGDIVRASPSATPAAISAVAPVDKSHGKSARDIFNFRGQKAWSGGNPFGRHLTYMKKSRSHGVPGYGETSSDESDDSDEEARRFIEGDDDDEIDENKLENAFNETNEDDTFAETLGMETVLSVAENYAAGAGSFMAKVEKKRLLAPLKPPQYPGELGVEAIKKAKEAGLTEPPEAYTQDLYRGHQSPVVYLSTLPDSQAMLSIDVDGVVCLWSAFQGGHARSGFGWYSPLGQWRLPTEVTAHVPSTMRVQCYPGGERGGYDDGGRDVYDTHTAWMTSYEKGRGARNVIEVPKMTDWMEADLQAEEAAEYRGGLGDRASEDGSIGADSGDIDKAADSAAGSDSDEDGGGGGGKKEARAKRADGSGKAKDRETREYFVSTYDDKGVLQTRYRQHHVTRRAVAPVVGACIATDGGIPDLVVIRRVSGLPAAALRAGGINAAKSSIPYFTAHCYSLDTMKPTVPRMDLPNPFVPPRGKGPDAAGVAAARRTNRRATLEEAKEAAKGWHDVAPYPFALAAATPVLGSEHLVVPIGITHIGIFSFATGFMVRDFDLPGVPNGERIAIMTMMNNPNPGGGTGGSRQATSASTKGPPPTMVRQLLAVATAGSVTAGKQVRIYAIDEGAAQVIRVAALKNEVTRSLGGYELRELPELPSSESSESEREEDEENAGEEEESEEEVVKTRASDKDIRDGVYDILWRDGVDAVSLKKIREELELKYEPLTERKATIKLYVDAFVRKPPPKPRQKIVLPPPGTHKIGRRKSSKKAPAPAAEKAPAAKRAGVQRALTEKEKKMPSDFEIKLGVTEILEKSEQESVSMRKIREQLEARYQTSLADKKAVMKAAVDAYYD